MKTLINYLMLTCQKASALIEKRNLFALTRKEKVMLRIHTAVCKSCMSYQKQSKIIDHALNNHFHSINVGVNMIIENKELKEKIISKL